jgi:hypothetical protein
MSKAEILAELPKLQTEERDQVLRKLCELQEEEMVRGPGPGDAERRILDDALAELERDGNSGTPWREALPPCTVQTHRVTWRVLIRAAAERDLDEARKWYNGIRPGLGEEFLVSMAEAFTRLEQDPERYRVLYKGFRRVLVDRFPYKILYQLSGNNAIVFECFTTRATIQRSFKIGESSRPLFKFGSHR